MSPAVSTVIGALSALAAVASALLYLHFGRRSELANAREEALALAETRRQVIRDLQRRLAAIQHRHRREIADCRRRVRDAEAAREQAQTQARDEAYRTQHFYAAALSDLLNELRRDLEQLPPDIDAALAQIRRLLDDERPAA